jgi:hypothetical protein
VTQKAGDIVTDGTFENMHSSRGKATCFVLVRIILGAGFVLQSAVYLGAEEPAPAQPSTLLPTSGEAGGQAASPSGPPASVCEPGTLGSPFIPVDSWVYPAMMRLYSLGYLDRVFLGLRPWTRGSAARMLEDAAVRIQDADPGPATDQAQEIFDALSYELRNNIAGPCLPLKGNAQFESVYTIARIISGTPLHDDFHLGSTIVNDYGRPFANGFNNYTGASGYSNAGRFTLYARGEFQYAPGYTGYSPDLAMTLSENDEVPYINPSTSLPYNQATIPAGRVSSTTTMRVMEAYVSALVMNHTFSFGKQDQWMGPAIGGAFAYSNNAEGIYSFEINRIEPLRIPWLSYITGPFRYEFMVGSLKGHVAPNAPWVHAEKVSFKPTENLEFGFERTVIWGGKDHVPITIHSFLKSFFSVANVTSEEKFSRNDPGARFGAFDFSWRLPFMRKWLTLYTDGEVHDDVSPIDAPRRASWRPGLYLSQVPGLPRLDVRAEAVYTDPPVSTSNSGRFMYWEVVQVQGYTNKGHLFGDWIGREDKGGQGWITYHLSGNEWLQVSYRNQKAAKDFIRSGQVEYGTTLNDIGFQAVKRLGRDFEVNGSFIYEHYKAPIYLAGEQTVTTTNIQLTWYPGRKVSF